MPFHRDMRTFDLHDIFQYVQDTDPALESDFIHPNDDNPEFRVNWLDTTGYPSNVWKRRNDADDGWLTVVTFGVSSYSDEEAQDAVAGMIIDTTSVDVTYTDATPELKFDVKDEYVQDTVGAMLDDTASIDFTYNDITGKISAVALPAGIDHGGLAGLSDDDHPQYVPHSLADFIGDLLVATDANEFSKLSVGIDGQVLTADSGATEGVSWQDPTGGTASTEELRTQVRNDTGVTIAKGTPVKISGNAIGGIPRIVKADADTVMPCHGLVETDIADGATGFIVRFGVLLNLDTSGFASASRLYVSGTAGTFTTTKPTSPAIAQIIAIVLVSHATTGALLVISDAPESIGADHNHTASGDGGTLDGAVFSSHFQIDDDAPVTPGGTGSLLVGAGLSDTMTTFQIMDSHGARVRIGETRYYLAKNVSGGSISRGQAVYISGQADSKITIAKADADAIATMPAVGIAAETISDAAYGYVLAEGRLTNFDTSAFTVGDTLYVSGTAGGLTSTKPGGLAQPICRVLVDDATDGVLLMLPERFLEPVGITFNMGDGVNVIGASEAPVAIQIPFSMIVTGWRLISVDNTSGSITILVYRAPTSTPTTFTEISGSSDPALSSATNNADDSISGDWSDVTLDTDDWVRAVVSGSPSGVKRVALSLVGFRIA